MDPDDASKESVSWCGCSMNEIYRNLSRWELRHVPPVQPSDTHAVLYHFPIRNFNEPPKPLRQHEKWDSCHVRLPCSSHSQYPVNKSDGSVTIESRWELIRSAFARPITDSRELERAILVYNSKYSKDWKFRALHKFFEEESTEEEKEAFFESTLPKIISLALRLPELIAAPIPLLKQGQNRSISISQQQVSCLLANAFLCTFPRRNTMKRKSEYSTFPNINFSRLFQSTGPQVIEKIKCICHYFRRVCSSPPLGVLTFSRRSLAEKDLPKWDESNAPLGVTPLHVSSSGTIEDQGQGLLQVDFANKFLGGGVLGSGCVQEEIRFVICPELLVSKLFTEALKPCEALILTGCEQFSKYTGYASTFTWAGNHNDETPMDESRRRQCNIAAIDALHFVQSSHQYREELIIRELNKAYVGFMHILDTPAPGVASGNWGCGAFGGEATLKALIQLIVCTITKRPLVYFTFGNTELRDAIHDIHTFFIENNVTVKQLWSYLKAFHSHKLAPSDLYGFICQMHCDKLQDSRVKASSSRIQRVITSTKALLLATKKKFTTDTSPGPVSFKKVKASAIQNVWEGTSIVDVSDDEEECRDQNKANVSSDLFSSESSPVGTSDGEKPGSSKLLTPSPKSQASGSVLKPASKFRQRSLLEMLDCDYNKNQDVSAKRFKANDAIDR